MTRKSIASVIASALIVACGTACSPPVEPPPDDRPPEPRAMLRHEAGLLTKISSVKALQPRQAVVGVATRAPTLAH